MACRLRRFCPAIVNVTRGVVINSQVILCIEDLARLPAVFYMHYQLPTIQNATATMPVRVQTASGSIPIEIQNGTPLTYSQLFNGTVYNLAKINVCGAGYCGGITSLQAVNTFPLTATTAPTTETNTVSP